MERMNRNSGRVSGISEADVGRLVAYNWRQRAKWARHRARGLLSEPFDPPLGDAFAAVSFRPRGG
jgi:hypothetical protein